VNPDDLARILDDLGERLGPTGEYLFELAVRQVYIEAATAAVLAVAWIAITAATVRPIYRWSQGDPNGHGGREMIASIGGMTWCLLGVLILGMAAYAVPAILNPEYAALRNLLGAIAP
jgi:hypothetical protein